MAPSNDLWVQIRQGFQLPELDSPLVEKQTQWLVNRPDYVNRSMARSSRYLFYIVEEVNRRNMPTEIALLPFVESALNPEAKSTAKAMGIWQFMPRTGQDFKLTQNVFRDERRDVVNEADVLLLKRLVEHLVELLEERVGFFLRPPNGMPAGPAGGGGGANKHPPNVVAIGCWPSAICLQPNPLMTND